MLSFEVSTLGFPLTNVHKMRELPSHFGIEIFYEWGGMTFWLESMKRVMQNRTGSFSIHSPFGYCDFSQTESEEELFRFMIEPFDMYHKLHGRHYVVHTNGHLDNSISDSQRADMRKLVAERLDKFQDICDREGVEMVVENVPDGGNGLFNHDQFLSLFSNNPRLSCIIDTGHAHIEHYDMYEIQRKLGNRLKAYHVHDNAGSVDSHLRFLSGISGGIDWTRFLEGVAFHTPNAVMTFEYNLKPDIGIKEYVEDAENLMKKISCIQV